jgi:hypothetical protein
MTMPARKLDDWLKGYGEFTENSESPQVFHLWVALGTIAGAAQRKISMHLAYFDIYTNMYIILVSPPGIGKKTTALRVGKNFLKAIQPPVHFATESSSASALIQLMASVAKTNPLHQSMTVFSSELGTLLGIDPVTMVDFLTDIFDCNPDWHKQTIARGKESIPHPWLNIIAGTTPQWLGEHLSKTAVEGGLVARCIYPFSDELKLENPLPKLDVRKKEIAEKLIHDLGIIAGLEGEFILDSEAEKFYSEWYLDRDRFPKLMDPRVAGYYGRKHIHVLKVAMALSLSYKNELVLLLEDIQRALVLLERTEPGMARAFSAVGKNEHSTDLERVLAQLQARGRMAYGELIAANYHSINKRTLDEILEQLRQMGEIAVDNRVWYIKRKDPPVG